MAEMTVWRKGKDTYKVSSQTTEGTFYRVRSVKGVWVCSCPHFTNRHTVEECKHIERVKEALRNQDYQDDTELGKLQTEILALVDKASELQERIARLEEGWKPSPGP